ncbi:MAG: hypothetical protein V3S00_06875, partial [Dehalococcoidia bacterium]
HPPGHLWRAGRLPGHLWTAYSCHSSKTWERPHDRVDYWWPELWPSRSSGWLAAKIAATVGHDPVVMCGCPHDARPYENGLSMWDTITPERLERNQSGLVAQAGGWPTIKSMSGLSRDLLGAP